MDRLRWWQRAVFYQIYPRSFADGNGDGIGDFIGMTQKLDYLRELGIDAIWLSPHFPSPFLDCGYDISDYCDVGPEYGTLDDFRAFLHAAHEREIKVILDLVLNHTSHEHAWFKESRASRESPKRDWYVWRDPKPDGSPPNNWESIFGGSAWEFDAQTGQYYYHAFLTEQPDLNWRNPEVKQAMWEAVRFWLDMGVDGFRLDAIATIYEDPALPDHQATVSITDLYRMGLVAKTAEDRQQMHEGYQQLFFYQTTQPGVHELMCELRELLDSYPGDRVLVGEDEDVAYHGSGDNELHLVFNFPLMRIKRLTPAHIRRNQRVRLAELPEGAWPCNTLGNHDVARSLTHYGDGVHDRALAQLNLALLLTLKGTPFLYNGEEIGMADLILSSMDQVRDTASFSHYRLMTEALGMSAEEAAQSVFKTTRDRSRTPLQWDESANAGFSPAGVAPWLPVHPNYQQGVNVAAQERDPDSLLSFYRRMLALRRATPALIAGAYRPLHEEHAHVLAFLREDEGAGQRVLVALNFSEESQSVAFEPASGRPRLLFSSHGRSDLDLGDVQLAPFEVLVAAVHE